MRRWTVEMSSKYFLKVIFNDEPKPEKAGT
jgi:hypothetical protein